jgi:hypothetical protein
MKKAKPPVTRAKRLMKFTTFKEFNNRIPSLSSENAELIEVPVGEPFPAEADNGLKIYVWGDAGKGTLVETVGNKTIHLTKQYYTRYDPPRTGSTGSQQTPKGDWHLYDGRTEIAAWDSEGKARHGFAPGTKIPGKAYKALQDKHPNAHGLKGGVLEDILREFGGRSFLIEG